MPHTPEHKIRVEDVFWQSPIPKSRREPTDEEFNAIFNRRAREYRKGLLDETSDEELFRKNEEFYKKHPTDTLKLTPTEHTTQYGRKVYKDQFGAIHSESTATVQSPKGGWMNIPLIYNGKYVTEDRARDIIINNGMVDPETGEKVRSYRDIPEAEEAARDRMRTLNKPDQPWNDWFVNPAKGHPADDSPINYEALGIIPQEPASLFNFVTDIKYDPKSFRVPVDPNPYRWGADMSGVKFGTVLPDRNTVEDMILEASGIAGVAPEYTEGLRTEAQNTKLGAHEKSKHLTGQAFDLAISRNKEKDKRYERELIRLFVPLGFSVILKSDHIHLQTPPPDVDLLPNSSWSN
jgi:hypothetical protein